jgi:hypothetical protein
MLLRLIVVIALVVVACGGKPDEPAAEPNLPTTLAATTAFAGKRAKVAKPAPPKVGDKQTIVRANRLLGQLRHRDLGAQGWDMVESRTYELEVLAVDGVLLRRRAAPRCRMRSRRRATSATG